MPPAFYYTDADIANKQSTQYALDLALYSYLVKLLFKGDVTRAVYASNEFAFRGRLSDLRTQLPAEGGIALQSNSLNLPFMNFWQTQELNTIERGWRSAFHVTQGTFIDELGTKLLIAPVGYQYEATAYFHKERDLDFAYDTLSWVAQYPLTLPDLALTWTPPGVEPDNPDGEAVTFPLSAVVNFDMQFNPRFKESDWLTQEHILTMTFDFTVQTFRMKLVDPNGGSFWIPTSVIFDFVNLLNIDDPTSKTFEELTTLVIDQMLGTVTDPSVET